MHVIPTISPRRRNLTFKPILKVPACHLADNKLECELFAPISICVYIYTMTNINAPPSIP